MNSENNENNESDVYYGGYLYLPIRCLSIRDVMTLDVRNFFSKIKVNVDIRPEEDQKK